MKCGLLVRLFVKELLFLPLGNYHDGSMVDCWREMENMSSRPALRGMGSGRMDGWGIGRVKAERRAEKSEEEVSEGEARRERKIRV